MNDFLSTIVAFFRGPLSVWSKFSGFFTTLIGELKDDEIGVIHGGIDQLTSDLAAGKSFGEAAADAWTYVKNQEGKELSKVGNLLMQTAVAKLEAHQQ